MPLNHGDFFLSFLRDLIQAGAKSCEVTLQFLHILFAEVKGQLRVGRMIVLDVQLLANALVKFVQQGVHILDLRIPAMRQSREKTLETLLGTRLVGFGDRVLVFLEACLQYAEYTFRNIIHRMRSVQILLQRLQNRLAAIGIDLQLAARIGQLLMKSQVIAAHDQKSREHIHHRLLESRNGAHGHAVQLRVRAGLPDLFAQKAKRHPHQRVVQVRKDDIISIFNAVGIKGDWSDVARVRVSKTNSRFAPGIGKGRHLPR